VPRFPIFYADQFISFFVAHDFFGDIIPDNLASGAISHVAKVRQRGNAMADFEVEHCGADNGTGMRDYIADWCAETFAEMG
jgi:hypothetical protein